MPENNPVPPHLFLSLPALRTRIMGANMLVNLSNLPAEVKTFYTNLGSALNGLRANPSSRNYAPLGEAYDNFIALGTATVPLSRHVQPTPVRVQEVAMQRPAPQINIQPRNVVLEVNVKEPDVVLEVNVKEPDIVLQVNVTEADVVVQENAPDTTVVPVVQHPASPYDSTVEFAIPAEKVLEAVPNGSPGGVPSAPTTYHVAMPTGEATGEVVRYHFDGVTGNLVRESGAEQAELVVAVAPRPNHLKSNLMKVSCVVVVNETVAFTTERAFGVKIDLLELTYVKPVVRFTFRKVKAGVMKLNPWKGKAPVVGSKSSPPEVTPAADVEQLSVGTSASYDHLAPPEKLGQVQMNVGVDPVNVVPPPPPPSLF